MQALAAKLSVIANATVARTVYVAVRVAVRVTLRVTVAATAYAMMWMDFAYVFVIQIGLV